jgi:hypothetical protein
MSMSNLKSARQSIHAELEHARQGVAYYLTRVEALEEALAKLESVESTTGVPARPSKASKVPKAPKAQKARGQGKVGRPPRAQAVGNGAKLPSTGKGFWPNLVTAQPQSAPEILDAAIKALGISPSKDQVKKLSQRQTSALNTLVKAREIADSGSGRERRFFRS